MRASDRAYTALRAEIVEGTLADGALLGEVEQSARLGVSRTPIREAISRLVADGLAVSSGRGTVVSPVSLDDVGDLFDLRVPLEVQAARLAALRADPEPFRALALDFGTAAAAGVSTPESYYGLAERLDAAIDHAVANPYLSSALKSLRLHLVRVRRLARHQPARLTASAWEHRSICSAIAAGDADLAAAATEVHLRLSLAHITDAAAPRGSEE